MTLPTLVLVNKCDHLDDVAGEVAVFFDLLGTEFPYPLYLIMNVGPEHRTPLEDETFKWGRFTFVPIFDEAGEIRRLMITITDITELKETQDKLENALTRVLSGFVTICATCKNIKEDSERWVPVEHYLSSNANDVQFSHGYCPKCYELAVQELK